MPRKKKQIKSATNLEKEILLSVNQLRKKGIKCGNQKMPAVAPLTYNDKLSRAARKHAKDMGRNRYFSHESRDGSGPPERIEDQGYQGFLWGENIAAGPNTIKEVITSWKKSEEHCRNMMHPEFKEIGIAAVHVKGSQYQYYWVQNFGSRAN